MAVTLVATVGSATANTFLLLAAADSYLEGKLPSPTTWDAATTDTKNRALVSASRSLTRMLVWVGRQVTVEQALAWPRQEVVNPADPDVQYFDEDVIPQVVQDATCELALLMVNAGTTDLTALPTSDNIKRKKVDVLETEYVDPSDRVTGLARFPAVLDLLTGLYYDTDSPIVSLGRA